jgi:hypothetical protein
MTTTFQVDIDWVGGTWTNETSYLRRVQILSGFARPDDPVATTGRCRLTLDNTSKRFSPGDVNGPLYGDLLPRRRVRVRAFSGESDSWTLFNGWIDRIEPDAGGWGQGEVVIECVDGLALLAQQRIGVSYASTKTPEDAAEAVVNATYTPPASDYGGPSDDVLEHYGRTWKPEETTALQALREICEAVYARFFIERNGTVRLLQRESRLMGSSTPDLFLEDAPLDDLVVGLDIDSVINVAQVMVYPVETIGTATTLWQSQTVLRLAPGETRVIYALFRDSNGERCGAVNVIAPVANTDYTVNEKQDGTGFDYTLSSSFSLSTSTEATRMAITLTNNAIGPLYVTLLKVRGKPIITYDPLVFEKSDVSSQETYQKRVRLYDLPMQANPNFGETLAGYIIFRCKNPLLRAERLVVQGRDVLDGVNLFSLGILDLILITDSQTGLNSAAHLIHAVEYDLTTGGYTITLHLERADAYGYWRVETENYSELNIGTRLAF